MTSSSYPDAGYVLVVNGRSGSSDDEVANGVHASLAEHGSVERHATEEPEDLDEVLADLGGRTLVVLGGDGSIHAAVARASRTGCLDEVTFGLVPLGTGNDLARTLGIPLDVDEAVAAVVNGVPRAIDLITYGDGDTAVNAAHAGIGADAAERAEPMKERVGALAYPVGAVAAGVAAEGWEVRVEVDGEVVTPTDTDGRTLMVAIGNGCTIGGGTRICPDARLDDGLLDVVVSHSVAPTRRTAYGTAMLRGTHVDRDDVATVQGRRITISGDEIPYNIDGELVGSFGELTFEVRPAAWTILTPRR